VPLLKSAAQSPTKTPTMHPNCLLLGRYDLVLSNIHPLTLQVCPRLQYLRLQLLIRLGNIIECEYAPAELEQ